MLLSLLLVLFFLPACLSTVEIPRTANSRPYYGIVREDLYGYDYLVLTLFHGLEWNTCSELRELKLESIRYQNEMIEDEERERQEVLEIQQQQQQQQQQEQEQQQKASAAAEGDYEQG